MIRCAMFDFGNVLGIFDTPRWYRFINKYRGNCLEPHEIFSGAIAHLVKDFDLGRINETEFYSQIRLAYRMSIPNQGDFFEEFGSNFVIDDEMFKIVKDLKQRGLATVLISNLNPFHDKCVTERHPEVFESFNYLMISSREGVAKPDSEAWIRPIEQLGLKPEECVFVDDSRKNIEVACGLGIKGWHYNVTDIIFCQNGRLEEERLKFKNFLTLLGNLSIFFDKNKSH